MIRNYLEYCNLIKSIAKSGKDVVIEKGSNARFIINIMSGIFLTMIGTVLLYMTFSDDKYLKYTGLIFTGVIGLVFILITAYGAMSVKKKKSYSKDDITQEFVIK